VRDSHAATAAAGHRFDHDRVANLFRSRQRVLFFLDDAVRSGRGGHTGFFGQRAAYCFVLQRIHRARTWPDEPNVAVFAYVGEMRVLGEETVARVNRVHICNFCRADDAVDAQVAFAAGTLADANRFVRKLHMHGVRVRLRIDGHGADVQFLAGADDAHGNFTAIGNENFLKHGFWVDEP
jgi:hypothetical protein